MSAINTLYNDFTDNGVVIYPRTSPWVFPTSDSVFLKCWFIIVLVYTTFVRFVMLPSRSTLKLILILLLSFRQVLDLAPPSSNVAVYVVALSNSSSSLNDVEIQVLSQNQPYQEPQIVNGQRLPPECVSVTNESLLCSNMLDVSNKSMPNGSIIILAPLMNGVLIQKFIHEDLLLRLVEEQPLFIESCSPVIMLLASVVPDYRGIYLLCKSSGLLSLVELTIDYSDLSKSKTYPQGSYVIDTTLLSNFIEVTSSETSIVFTSSDRLYQLDLQEGFFSAIGDLPSGSCVPVVSLVFVSDTLLVHCSDSSVVYYESDGTFLNQTDPHTDGALLVCPDPDIRLAVFNGGDYIKLGLWSKSTYFQISLQTDIYSSVCLGSKTALHFVYTNATGSHAVTVNLLQYSGYTALTLDMNSCKLGACKPLMVFYNQWVLLQVVLTPHDSSVMVFDSSNGLAMVLERLHVDNIAVGTILTMLKPSAPIPLPVTVSTSASGPVQTSVSPQPSVTSIVLPSILVPFLVIIAVVAVVVGLILLMRYHNQRKR